MAGRTGSCSRSLFVLSLLAIIPVGRADGEDANYNAQAIFEPEAKHNHASCLIETARGDLLAAWYSGTGERNADDVVIQGAWLARGSEHWEPRFLMADTPGYPDCNPALFAAPGGAIWLFWPTILDHRWEGALLKYAVADATPAPPAPVKWARTGVLHLTPASTEFAAAIAQAIGTLTEEEKKKYQKDLDGVEARSRDLLYQRLGWMPRVHPIVLPSGRWILPLYCDTFSASIMALSDDQGGSWSASRLMVGFGNIQPSLVRKKDGTLVAFMRDNGPHRRIRLSTSHDDGMSWTPAMDTAFPNPGAGIEAVRLASGNWAIIYNDTARGRHTLAVALSDDEGASWKWTRHIQRREPGQGSFHYPSIIQGREGEIHVTYTHHVPGQGSTIMYARFNEAWIRQGDERR